MANYTITRYLKLKIADDLSSDAKYNLSRIDSLGETFITDTQDNLQIKATGDVSIEPESPDIGGAGNNTGNITLGTANNTANVLAYSTSFRIRSPLGIKNSNETYLSVGTPSTAVTAALLTFDVNNADKTVLFKYSGEVVTTDGSQTLTNKTLSGLSNTFSNISYSSLLLSGSITNSDIAAGANIADTKLATISTAGKVANSATTATPISAPNAIVLRNGNGDFAANVITATLNGTASNITASSNNTLTTLSSLLLPGSQVSGNISGNAANVTGVVAVANGGTGAGDKSTALINLTPTFSSGDADKVLSLNSSGTAIIWKAAGTGTLTAVTADAPLSIDNTIITAPKVVISQASGSTNGYLSSTDWSTFNSKENAITAGTTGQYWRGDKSWQTLDKSAVGLSNVDNTSDVNKPVSSATQTALNAKYDSSNPASYVNAAGAKAAAVVNSTAGNETDQAPSVSAMKSYVAAQGGGSVAYTWSIADGATKSITHSLNKNTVSVTVYDENGEDILIDTVDRLNNNTVVLSSSSVPTGNWTVIIRP